MLTFFDGMCFTFTSKLTKTADTLPVSSADKSFICDALGEDGYTYLTLATQTGTEIVRVQCNGSEPFIDRAQGGTEPVTVPLNGCACFQINQLILEEYLGVQHCEPVIETDQPDYITITAPSDDPDDCTWKVNLSDDLIERLNSCCPDDECGCDAECNLANGVYENATITVIDGKVCAIENGKNIVYTGGCACGCSGCDTETTVETGTVN